MASDPNDVTQELDRRKRFEDVKQYEFKRRCAFYSFFILTIELGYAISAAQFGTESGRFLVEFGWIFGAIIITAMSAEALTAFSAMRGPGR